MENTVTSSTKDNTISPKYGYGIGAFIVGILVFIGVWFYAFETWGFLVGLAFGWIPAIIAGIIAGMIWPLIILVVLAMILSSN